ncbi:MAG: hypothetical protein ACRC2T_17540, partial [Thermoguttaceae bacterium]
DLLSQTNINGAAVFGAVSEPVIGSTDFNPSVTGSTLLSSLNNGKGVQQGTIRVAYSGPDGARESIIDLSKCVTVDDVRNTIAKNSPTGTVVKLGLTDNGLSVEFSSQTPGGSITITEIGSTMTAHNLGIYSKNPITSGQKFIGSDLNPAVMFTTSLDSLFGAPARTTLRFQGDNNDILIQANYNGESFTDKNGNTYALNGVKFAFESSASVAPGSETARFDAETNTVLVSINPDNSTAANIVGAINRATEAGEIPPFTASVDPLDQGIVGCSRVGIGDGIVSLLPGKAVVFGTTDGGVGQPFDKTSGIQLVNGGKTFTIDFGSAKTVDDLLGILNDPKYGLLAEINSTKTGINVRSRISGTDFMIGENGGITATQLGIRTMTKNTLLNELDFKRGVMDFQGEGTNAYAIYQSKSANSGLLLTAIEEGTAWNDYEVIYTPTADPDGKVTIAWDQDAKTITIGINPGVTKACEVVIAFNEQPGPNQAFTMELDGSQGINTGQGVVYDGKVITADGTDGGVDFMITRNDGTVLDIDINGAKTVGDVIDLINNHPRNTDKLLFAKLNDFGNGIELVDNSIGQHTTLVERAKLSTAAIDLGLIPRGEEYQATNAGGVKASVTIESKDENSELIQNSQLLVMARQTGQYANDVKIEFLDMNRPGGSGQPGFVYDSNSKVLRFEISPGVTTAADVIKLFQDNATQKEREMFTFQNGLNPDGSTSNGSGTVSLFPRPVDPTNPNSGVVEAPKLLGGENNRIIGSDPNPLETESLYTAMIRLQVAMEKNDVREIERATNLLDKAAKVLSYSRADIGIQQNGLDTVLFRLQDENVQFRQILSNSLEINLSDTILEYSASTLAYQASLQVTSRMFQMSLLNYI